MACLLIFQLIENTPETGSAYKPVTKMIKFLFSASVCLIRAWSISSPVTSHISYQGIVQSSYQPQDFKGCVLGIEFPWRTSGWCDDIKKKNNVVMEELYFPLVWTALSVIYNRKRVITVPFNHCNILPNSPFMEYLANKEGIKFSCNRLTALLWDFSMLAIQCETLTMVISTLYGTKTVI